MKNITFLIVLLLFIVSCKKQSVKKDLLGAVNISVSGNNSALPHFERGLLLLHSFEYEDAREEFKKAKEKDPKMAMAYWGEAMTYNHGLWHEQDYEAATVALAHLKKIDLDKLSELEKDFIEATRVLYQEDTDKNKRDIAYAEYMGDLYKKYPNNQEVAAFYALSLLGSVAEGRDDKLYGKGAIIAQGILKENPKHPGALHYLIHSYDDPAHASLALNAANAYSKVAPDASHALHMPSHIYVAMGMWDEVISSNINSYHASLDRMRKKNLSNDARGYHAFHWLEYGYLQKNNKTEAKKMIKDLQQYVSEEPSKRARAHLVFLKGTYLNESDDWKGEIAAIPVDISDLNISIRSQYHFLEGMKSYHLGNAEKLDSILQLMSYDYKRETFVASKGRASLCSNVTRDEATSTDLKESEIRQTQLQALRANLANDIVMAEKLFLKSIALERSISYNYGPPTIQKPTHELYADWLLLHHKKEKAMEQYSLALKYGPGRLKPLEGIKKAEQII